MTPRNDPADEPSPTDQDDIVLVVTRWHKERADPDYDPESVIRLVEGRSSAEFVEWLAGPPESDSPLARFRVEDVEHEGEAVDYSIELPQPLLKAAVDEHPDL